MKWMLFLTMLSGLIFSCRGDRMKPIDSSTKNTTNSPGQQWCLSDNGCEDSNSGSAIPFADSNEEEDETTETIVVELQFDLASVKCAYMNYPLTVEVISSDFFEPSPYNWFNENYLNREENITCALPCSEEYAVPITRDVEVIGIKYEKPDGTQQRLGSLEKKYTGSYITEPPCPASSINDNEEDTPPPPPGNGGDDNPTTGGGDDNPPPPPPGNGSGETPCHAMTSQGFQEYDGSIEQRGKGESCDGTPIGSSANGANGLTFSCEQHSDGQAKWVCVNP